MKLAIIGSRTFTDYALFSSTIGSWFWEWESTGPDGEGHNRCKITEVISGGAEGADSLAARWVEEHNGEHFNWLYQHDPITLTVIRPDYDRYLPAQAPLIRNGLIAEQCDMMLAFWTGEPKSGTRNAIGHATRLKKPTMIIYV